MRDPPSDARQRQQQDGHAHDRMRAQKIVLRGRIGHAAGAKTGNQQRHDQGRSDQPVAAEVLPADQHRDQHGGQRPLASRVWPACSEDALAWSRPPCRAS
jgi:hypothetical protein